ncbi:MAG TPA: methyl-accepting chemotaxis protein, partial [Azospirillaceae bacterium]|nr:methyl-accepting chemotaxis protein [Azospirillaceae bacterium]
EETTAAAQSMATQAGDLRSLMAFFQTEASTSAPRAIAAGTGVASRPARSTGKAMATRSPSGQPPHSRPSSSPRTLKRAAGSEDADWQDF